MTLQFSEPARKPYEADNYFGRNIDKMPELLEYNRLPLSVSGFMKLRLKALDLYASILENPKDSTPEYKREVVKFFHDLWGNYADTGDGILYHPDGKIRTDLDSESLRQINPKSKMTPDGAVRLKSGLYAASKMPELSKEEVQKYTGKLHSGEEALDNKLWRVFARDPNEVLTQYAEDPALLKTYVKAFNHLAKTVFDYNNGMKIYVGSPQKGVETARLVYVDRLESRSNAAGWARLDDDGSRLVGVAPEAPRLTVPSSERLEQIIATITKHSPEVQKLLAA